jgi:diguanylate cyclase (GGDEF)-like protein
MRMTDTSPPGLLARPRVLLARFVPRRGYRLASGERAVWALSGALVLAASVLFLTAARGEQPVVPTMQVPFWALLVGCAAAERFVVHLHFRRSAHTMSLGEIPFVFGLVFASGAEVILAWVLGRLFVLAVHRRLPPIRLAFNLGQFFLGSVLGVLVFHAIAGSAATIGPRVWVAAGAATATNSVIAVLLIAAAVSLSEGVLSPRQVAGSLGTDLAVVAANTSVALCAAILVFGDWKTGILMVIPVAGMFVTYRAYVSERQRHERLEFLYEAARTLSHSPEIGPALEGLLARALEAFRAEVAEIVFFARDGQGALRTTVRAQGPSDVLEQVEPEVASQLRWFIEGRRLGAAALGEVTEAPVAGYLQTRGLSAGMFAVLKGERGWTGAIMLGDPSGVVDRFSPEDLKLFETLANNTSVALQNDHRGQAVRRMQELQRELAHRASHDPLTDLANRSLFTDRVRAALRSGGGSASVIFIDIDDFKTVNDSLGHAAGDELLIAVARRLRDCTRSSETVARLGGDEFAILLERSDSADEAVEVAQRVIHHLGERFAVGEESVSVRASAGIAIAGEGAASAEELIRNADVAMYRAKQGGKNGYELFMPGMEVPVLRRHGLKQRLREAVKESSFIVHYQPIVALPTGEVVACEALVRWLDGPRGPVHPHAFIPVAEEMGVIVPIGRSVLERACRDARAWQPNRTAGVGMHVNVSPVELRDPDFLHHVAATLVHTGLNPSQLMLEITESVVLREPEKSIATLNELRRLGVRVALDDFGTGYSSLSHLRSLPIDCLKIGTPFVDGLAHEDGVDRPFVRMIIELAADLGVAVVAEGIETSQQLAVLRELGCGLGQGFYLGSPAELGSVGVAPSINPIDDFEPTAGGVS